MEKRVEITIILQATYEADLLVKNHINKFLSYYI